MQELIILIVGLFIGYCWGGYKYWKVAKFCNAIAHESFDTAKQTKKEIRTALDNLQRKILNAK